MVEDHLEVLHFHGRLWPDRNGNLWHASGVGGCDV